MSEPGFAPPANQLGQLGITQAPTGGQAFALEPTGYLPSNVFPQWITYTPSLTASTTSPSLGSSATQTGKYVQYGRLVAGRAVFVFGTSPAAGTGTYQISLPVTAASSGPQVGSGTLLDNSASLVRLVACELASTSVLQMRIDNTGLGLVTAAVPWTWAVNDQISVQFTYEAA